MSRVRYVRKQRLARGTGRGSSPERFGCTLRQAAISCEVAFGEAGWFRCHDLSKTRKGLRTRLPLWPKRDGRRRHSFVIGPSWCFRGGEGPRSGALGRRDGYPSEPYGESECRLDRRSISFASRTARRTTVVSINDTPTANDQVAVERIEAGLEEIAASCVLCGTRGVVIQTSRRCGGHHRQKDEG